MLETMTGPMVGTGSPIGVAGHSGRSLPGRTIINERIQYDDVSAESRKAR